MIMKIQICMWKMCKEKYSEYILKRLNADVEKFDFKWIFIEESPCMWMCKTRPNVKFDKNIETNCNPIKASKILNDKIKLKT